MLAKTCPVCHTLRMIVDEVKIHIHAGNGGDGKVAFDTSKGGRGVTGGSGGRGGDTYVEGVSNLSALKQFRHKKDFAAGNGGNGKAKTLDGADGAADGGRCAWAGAARGAE